MSRPDRSSLPALQINSTTISLRFSRAVSPVSWVEPHSKQKAADSGLPSTTRKWANGRQRASLLSAVNDRCAPAVSTEANGPNRTFAIQPAHPRRGLSGGGAAFGPMAKLGERTERLRGPRIEFRRYTFCGMNVLPLAWRRCHGSA